jgi:lysozyme
MADIKNSIQIALAFAKKWERLSSSSPASNVIFSNTDSLSPNQKVYAYYDSIGKVWTIGWGNTYYKNGSNVKSGDSITKAEADDLALWAMSGKEVAIRSFIPYQFLTDNEYASLISIAYNAGEGNLKASRIPSALNSGITKQEVANVIQDSIVTAKGVFNQGLKNRRIDESKLFLGEYNAVYSYYLRNEKTINYTVVGLVLIVMTLGSIWYYHKIKK